MASAPAPTRNPPSYQKIYICNPVFSKENQCYTDENISLIPRMNCQTFIKCGLCDGDRVFKKRTNFKQHTKTDRHQRKLKEFNLASHRPSDSIPSNTPNASAFSNASTLFNERNLTQPVSNVTEVSSDESEADSVITTDTSMPALTPIQEVKPVSAPTPAVQPTQDLYHTVLLAEIDRLNQVIRQRDAQIGHLKQTIIHFGEYLRYEEAL